MSDDQHPLIEQRLAKIEALRDSGTDPYPVQFAPSSTAAEIHAEFGELEPEVDTGTRVSVAGRVMMLRNIGKLVFAVLQDASGRIQLFVDQGVLGDDFDRFADLDLGDWVGALGEVMTTRRGELSVRIEEFSLLAKAIRPLPEKWHGLSDLETRHRQRYLDLIVNEEARRIMEARSLVVRTLRSELEGRGFLEVETPMLQLQPGGALARPFRTHHNTLGLDMYLRIAPELYLKRLVVGGVERVFEINRNFRNEGMSPRHNPEFTMLEVYQAFADYFDMIDLTEALVAATAVGATGGTKVSYQGVDLDLTPPYRRVTYLGAIEEATGTEFATTMATGEAAARAAALGIEVEDGWPIGKIVEEVFEETTEADLLQPTVVMDFPKEISPLARTHRDDPALTERFELIVMGRELANAFSELNDPAEQRRRFEAQAAARAAGDDEAHPIDEDYIRALEYGLPPTGGMGLGVDRLVMLLTDQASIREVILFPHLKPES